MAIWTNQQNKKSVRISKAFGINKWLLEFGIESNSGAFIPNDETADMETPLGTFIICKYYLNKE